MHAAVAPPVAAVAPDERACREAAELIDAVLAVLENDDGFCRVCGYPVTRTLRAGVVALIAGTLLAVILEACLTELLFEDDDDGACVCPEAPNASRCV